MKYVGMFAIGVIAAAALIKAQNKMPSVKSLLA